MGTRTSPNKVLQDIEDCILCLKNESINGKNPINDDSATLHRLQEKLELILMCGLLEKPGILGPKKTYWNYICTCFISSKRNHDGINFVKSIVYLKTSFGRGRAFIRYCLTQKCLADTLQTCFMNPKVSRDFYSEQSLIMQGKLWSSLVTLLYDLNELNFDLSAGYTELDISWPKFARKVFVPSEVENFPYKGMYASSLKSSSSQGNLEVLQLADLNEELSRQNKHLLKEVKCLQEEKLTLHSDIQKLETRCQSMQEQLKIYCKENCNESLNSLECSELKKVATSLSMSDLKENYLNTDQSTIDITSNENNFASDLSMKRKVHTDVNGKKSDYVMQQNDNAISKEQVSNTSNAYHENIDKLLIRNMCLPSYNLYLSEILLEFKTVIDDIEDILSKSEVNEATPHISRLRRIRTGLEEIFSSNSEKSKECLSFNNFVENCISCFKNFTIKQECVINCLQEKIDISIDHNHKLYSRIITLKDLLWSYGFLKLSKEKDIEPKNILLPINVNSVMPSTFENFSLDSIAHDPILKRVVVPLIPLLNSMFGKLNNLNEKMVHLEYGLNSSQELNSNLISRVQDQEIHLKGVTKELEEAQHLVSVMKQQHKKLQSAEGILKYDLQEKRKLLTRLKQQLENTREDFNLVRIKNSKSEAEWQDLRKEFVQRHKQTSEESGFVDDKGFEEYESGFSNSGCSSSVSEEASENISVNNTSEVIYPEEAPKKRRLDLLEEQCQNLYSRLLQSSKRHIDIDKHLDVMCRKIEKSNRTMHTSSLPSLQSEHCSVNINDISPNASSENICQNVIFPSDNFTVSPHSSSDVGSLNSECSSCLPGLCVDTNSSDGCCCDSSKSDSGISLSPLKVPLDAIQVLAAIEQSNKDDIIVDSEPTSRNFESKGDGVMCSSCESIELYDKVQSNEVQNSSLSHVDSLLIKKKDLEESLKILEIDSELASNKKEYLGSEHFAKQISALEEEKRCLLNKICELEKKILMLSTELNNVTQQLILSNSTKEHEIAALQFQLNTEALKYESTIKEFSEQSKGLENMKQRITEQEDLILALEEALTEIRIQNENEKEQQWQESMSEVEKEKNKNELLVTQLLELKAYSQKDKESIEAELVDLQNVSRDLKKRLVKLLKEKDLLWKRSNHLYHLQKIKINDRWMDDSEVSNCLGCKNNFSFMLRKHHCRICGRIFCYSCSNNWLLTASSSKKLRACNECFMQYIEIKKDVRRGSDVPQVDESEDEEHNLSFIPTSCSSFNSEVPSSITNSVISLPITQKQNTPLFASAPDLRYIVKTDEIPPCSESLVEDIVLEENEKDKNILVINDEQNEDISIELNKELKETEISSDECTSITFEDTTRATRLKEISITEIIALENGLSSEFIINSGEKADLPIFCQSCPILLKWSFTPDCQGIPMIITHRSGTSDDETTVICKDKHKLQDEMELSLPGYYVFHFDNSNRIGELKMQCIFLVKNISQVEEAVHQKQ